MIIQTVEALYGASLEKATRQQLGELLCHCAIEFDSRHSVRDGGKDTEILADGLIESSDEALLTVLIAAAIKLRVPNSVEPMQTAIAA